MAMNYMSRSILFTTHQNVTLYSITESKVIGTRSFSDILNEPSGKSELYQIENL